MWLATRRSLHFAIRIRVPHGVKLMPHRHPEDRIYAVIYGVFYIGLGDEFNEHKGCGYVRTR